MAEQPQPRPLEAGTQVPGALDHAWVVERMDQQYQFGEGTGSPLPDGASLWLAQVRCVHCGLRATFRAQDVPPCRPQGERPTGGGRGPG